MNEKRPVLVGYARPFMERPVLGVLNLAYLFALSQFFMAWLVAALYMRAAGRFDVLAGKVTERLAQTTSQNQGERRKDRRSASPDNS